MDEDLDEDARAILARRRKFVVKALGGVAIVAAGCAEPAVCLKIAAPDATTTATAAAGQGLEIRPIDPPPAAPKDAGVEPKEPKEPAPHPCLKIARPRDR